MIREKKYFRQADHLFPYYLFSSVIIALVIILIRFLTLYDFNYVQLFEFWYENGNMPCYGAILVAIFAMIHSLRSKTPVGELLVDRTSMLMPCLARFPSRFGWWCGCRSLGCWSAAPSST